MHATLPLPTSDVDLFADDVLHDPYPALRELREAGPAVRLTRGVLTPLTRFRWTAGAAFPSRPQPE